MSDLDLFASNGAVEPKQKKANPWYRSNVGMLMILILLAAATALILSIVQLSYLINTPPDPTNSAASPTAAADVGNGTATGVHASAASDWTSPQGNGSPNSFNSNNWAIADYWQFSLDTTGFLNIQLQWDQNLSATGPNTFDLAYSTNGGTSFTVGLNNYVIPVVTWGGTADGSFTFPLDLSAVSPQ